MNEIITVGVDIAKNLFQVHAVDAAGEPVVRRQLRRRQVLPFFEKLPPCLIGIEACATSHYWAREIAEFGHEVPGFRSRGNHHGGDRDDLRYYVPTVLRRARRLDQWYRGLRQ